MKNNDWKARLNVVYSTNPNFAYETTDTTEDAVTLPPEKQVLRVSIEKKNRGGKVVTLIKGFVGTESDLSALAKMLKVACGTGGNAKDGEILIQGDMRARVSETLKKAGYIRTR